MADNTTLNIGTGGDALRTDDNAGIKTPVTKIELGIDGAFNGFVAATNPLPVAGNTVKNGTGTVLAILLDADGNVQCDLVGALPAGTNAIGKLAANNGVDIGDVDVASIIPGTGATNLGKAVDSASGATDTGVAPLAVRDDALSALTPVESDYVPLRVDANGALWTIHSGTIAATQSGTWNIGTVTAVTSITNPLPAGTNAIGKLAANSGVDIGDVDITSIIPGTGATNLGKAVDSLAGATDTGMAILAIRDDALSALTPVEGDYAPTRVDANGALWVITSGNTTVVGTGTFAVQVSAALPTGTNNIGDVDVLTVPAPLSTTGGGTEATALRVTVASDSTGVVSVDDNAGSLTVDGTVTANLAAGTNNIGDVDVLTQPARVRTTDTISAALATDALMVAATALTPKFAKFSSATTGNQSLVAAVAGKIIRILSLQVIGTAGTNAIYLNDGTADLYADATRKIPLDVTGATGPGGLTLPFSPLGWFETAAVTRAVNINLGLANGVVAVATYVEV